MNDPYELAQNILQSAKKKSPPQPYLALLPV